MTVNLTTDMLPLTTDQEAGVYAGPIIEREWLDVTPWPNESDEDLRWQCKQHDSIDCVAFGPTPAHSRNALLCGKQTWRDEVEVPNELA
jgi:hypothetical protein